MYVKLALLGRIVGPLVELDVDVVEVLVLDEVELDVGLALLVRLDELVDDVEEVVEVFEVVAAALELLEVVEVFEVVAAALELLEVVEIFELVAAALELLEEVDVVEGRAEDEVVAMPFWYILRRFGPPQYSFLSALQTMLHSVWAGVVPATFADPALILLPQ